MECYAYSKREQTIEHLTVGGIVFDDAIEVKKKKAGIPLTYSVNTADAFVLPLEDFGNYYKSVIE